MTVIQPSTNQPHRASITAKTFEPEASPAATASLAVFTKLLSHRDENQLKDVDSSVSTARTSCASSSHDGRSDYGNDLHWDELSTSSGGDQELDVWSPRSRGHMPVGTSASHGEAGKPVTAWSEPLNIGGSHTLRHAASPTVGSTGNSWSNLHRSSSSGEPPSVSVPRASPRYMANESGSAMPSSTSSLSMTPPHYRPHLRRPSPAALPQQQPGKGFFVGSPLQLTPVHLAALAANANAQAAISSFAPRLRPVVHPINIGPPTEYDFRNTNGLMKCVNSIEQLATPEALSSKHLVINELQRTVDEWMRSTFPDEKETTATLLLGGSWHLKVGMSDSDLDVVVLLPNFVTSEHFFSSLYEYLKSMASVTKLVAMNKAAVPILAFQLNQVRIDLLFARFTQNVVPKNLPIHSDHILAGMDATSIRSLSVPRVASLILELVPNDSAFRSCLRIIRLWAKRRGVYSNKAGFLGGVSWTILVAFVCQMFPKATISSIIHRFFSILSTWNWPTPILLSKPYECAGVDSSLQWCPQKNHHDRAHVMPIITPGFPAVNSAVNVNASTLRILKEEFERGKTIMDDMQSKGLSSPAVWHKLFAPSEFLVRYDHYVVVEVKASSDDELTEWSSYVASRTRKLVETLQHTSPIQDVHPFPELVKPHASASSGGYYFIGYTLQKPPANHRRPSGGPPSPPAKAEDAMKASVATAIRYFSATEIDNCPERRQGMEAEISYRKWQELPESVFPQGRSTAAGERARFILSRAHTSHVALGHGR